MYLLQSSVVHRGVSKIHVKDELDESVLSSICHKECLFIPQCNTLAVVFVENSQRSDISRSP